MKIFSLTLFKPTVWGLLSSQKVIIRQIAVWFLLLILFMSCGLGTSIRNRKIYIDDNTPKPPKHPIKIYQEDFKPDCPYEVIASMQIDQGVIPGENRETVWTLFKDEARKLGGDAILIVWQQLSGLATKPWGSSTTSVKNMKLQVIGDVIRFKLGIDCEKELTRVTYEGKQDSAKLLVEMGINVNAIDEKGATPLMIASMAGHIELVEFLIANDAFMNVKSFFDGSTALIAAAKVGNTEIVRLLIDNNADFTLKDKKGRTALSYANENGHTQIVNIIEQQSTDFKKAQKIHTVEAYEDFLTAFPNSLFAEEVRKQIDKIRFEQVQKIHSMKAYENFLKRFPNNIYAQKARDSIERFPFEPIEKINTLEAYEEFLKQYPNSKFAEEARLNIEKLKFGKLLREKSIDNNTQQRVNVKLIHITQKKLKELGYYTSMVDGIWRIPLETALKKFQKENDLDVTGKIDEPTARRLGIVDISK